MPAPDVDAAAPPTPIVFANEGRVANTRDPLPVSSVMAAARFADDGVAAHVPTDAIEKLTVPLPVIGPPVNPAPVATLVTVPPELVELRVPATKLMPDPIMTLLKPPAPLPYRIDVPLVAGA